MRLAPHHLFLLASLLAIAGCQAPAAWPVDARFGLLPERFRRDPSTVPLTGAFAPPDVARAQAQQPVADVAIAAVRGRVVGLTTGQAAALPIAGALVGTSDGRAGLTDAEGRFGIAGAWPADGGLAVSHPDWVATASVFTGPQPEAGPEVRLSPRAVRVEGASAANERPFVATGRVLGPGGAPIAEALVTLGDASGAFSAPVTTDGDGRFALTVFAAGRAVTAGTLVAVGTGEQAWIGVAGGKAASPDAPDLGDVAVVEAALMIAPSIDGSALPGVATRTFVTMVADDGTALDLPRRDQGWRIGVLAGASFELRAEAADPLAGLASELRQPLAPDDPAPRATLLAPPGADFDPALILNEGLTWPAVPGARVYAAALATLEGSGLLWEGTTATPALTFAFQEPLGPGTYGLSITAWDVPDPLAPGRTWRRASRQARVELR